MNDPFLGVKSFIKLCFSCLEFAAKSAADGRLTLTDIRHFGPVISDGYIFLKNIKYLKNELQLLDSHSLNEVRKWAYDNFKAQSNINEVVGGSVEFLKKLVLWNR